MCRIYNLNTYYKFMHCDYKEINKIIILLVIFAVMWQIYNYIYRVSNNDHLSNIKIADMPFSIKCFFGEPGCDEGNIDGWTIIHGLTYFIIGLIVPNQYLAIVIISILFEIVRSCLGNNVRYILNFLVNMTGYGIGSVMSPSVFSFKEKYNVFVG